MKDFILDTWDLFADYIGEIVITFTTLAIIAGIVILFTLGNGGCPKGQSLQVGGWVPGDKGTLQPFYVCEKSQ